MLAESGWGRIVLACRNEARGKAAIDQLKKEMATKSADGINFELVIVDMEDMEKCRLGARNLFQGDDDDNRKLDCVILNAGKPLPQGKALKLTSDGYSTLFAMHCLGPIAFTHALMAENKLRNDATIIYVASEAARGIAAPIKKVDPPPVPDGKVVLEEVAKGGDSRAAASGQWDDLAEYGRAKLIGVMYFKAFARHRPGFHVFSVLPGSTEGANAQSEYSEGILGMFSTYVFPVLKKLMVIFGVAHSVDAGTDRYVQLANRPTKFSGDGTFYASDQMSPMVGPISDQAKFHPVMNDEAKQAVIYECLENVVTKH